MQLWVQWITKSIYPGMRRISLSTQVDDLLLETSLWDPVNNTDTGVNFRLSAQDLSSYKTYQDTVNKVCVAFTFGVGYECCCFFSFLECVYI